MGEWGANIEILSQETGEYLKILKSINEAIETSLEWEINPDKTSEERGGSIRLDALSIGLTVPSNKLLSSSNSYGIGIVWVSLTTSVVDTPNISSGEIG